MNSRGGGESVWCFRGIDIVFYGGEDFFFFVR